MLTKRIITAFILAPLIIWAIFAMPNYYFAQLLLIFTALGAWEFSRLIKFRHLIARTLLVFSIVICALIIQKNTQIIPFILYLSALWWTINLYWVVSYPSKTNFWFDPLIVRIINGVLLLVPMWIALITLKQQYGSEYFLLLMLITWGADSGAYFTGKAIGKWKLAPKLSSGKSIEGVIGGIVVALVVMMIFLQNQNIATNQYLGYLLLTVVIANISVLGDLFESLFKRISNIKDSGQILPGHGGILDRIDSLTATAPFFLLGLDLI